VITNNSNQSSDTSKPAPKGYDIVIGSPIDTSWETDNANGAVLSSAKNFEILPLADGKSTVITAGSSGSIVLDRADTIDGVTDDAMGYQLIVSSCTWLVPLVNLSIQQELFPPPLWDAITVTADDFEGMTQTQDFYQTVAAFPNSKLAQDYAAAMTQTSSNVDSKADGSDGSTQAMKDTIASGEAAFFQNTQNYKQVTADQICLLEFYYDNFPFVWANYDSATYYLYSNSDDGTATTFAGTLTLTKPATIDITLPNAGYTCSFNPAVNPSDLTKTDVDPSQAKSLTYADGLFTEDNSANPDMPAIALKGMFGLKRTFTKVSKDNTVIVVIGGTVNQLKTMGFDQSQAKAPDDSTQDWLNSLFHPQTAAGIFNSVMTILGALMMLHFVATTLFGIGKWIRQQLTGKPPKTSTTSDEFKQLKQQVADQQSQINELKNEKLGNKNPLPEDSVDAQAKATSATTDLSNNVSKAKMIDSAETMDNSLKNIEKYKDSMTADDAKALQNSATDLKNAVDPVMEATPDTLGSALDTARPQMTAVSQNVSDLQTSVSEKVSTDAKADIKTFQDDMTTMNDALEEEANTAKDEANDPENADPDTETVDFPPE
jgi:hypothetical protein